KGGDLGVDKVTFEPVRVDTYKDVFTPLPELIAENADWLPDEDLRYDHKAKADRGGPARCYQPWKWITINYNGDVMSYTGQEWEVRYKSDWRLGLHAYSIAEDGQGPLWFANR
ncbi:MAG: hypothetical protein AAB322_00280, partial [Pseudomonadota bacterium]